MRMSSMISLAFSGVMAGWTWSLTVHTGASPQAPRQDTVSTVNSMSSVVGFFSVTPKMLRISSRMGTDFLTWQAVPSQILIMYFPFGSREKFS